jgi:hypothetical protein
MANPNTTFILASMPRSGTHLLRDCLEKHPEIKCHSECFNVRYTGIVDRSIAQWFQVIFDVPKPVVGFTLHHSHGIAGDYSGVRSLMKKRYPDFRVLRLSRNDLFAQYVSHEMARRKQKWTLRKDEAEVPNDVQFNVVIPKMFKYFTTTWNAALSDLNEVYVRQPILRISYEDLVNDLADVMGKVCEFLGIEPCKVQTDMAKQVTTPICKVVMNYRDCVAAIKNSAEWQHLLKYRDRWEAIPTEIQ